MEPELKTYLEGMEKRLDARFESIENKMATNTSEIMEVILDLKENTAKGFERVVGQIEELNIIVSDTGLGGRMAKVEREVADLKLKAA